MKTISKITGTNLCQNCGQMVSSHIDSEEFRNKDGSINRWEVSEYCTECGSFLFMRTAYPAK
jgi:hypothetical protein